MPQEPSLFAGTVKENIARFRDRLGEDQLAIDEAAVEAAQLAGAHELILQLPGGYDYQLGLGGQGAVGRPGAARRACPGAVPQSPISHPRRAQFEPRRRGRPAAAADARGTEAARLDDPDRRSPAERPADRRQIAGHPGRASWRCSARATKSCARLRRPPPATAGRGRRKEGLMSTVVVSDHPSDLDRARAAAARGRGRSTIRRATSASARSSRSCSSSSSSAGRHSPGSTPPRSRRAGWSCRASARPSSTAKAASSREILVKEGPEGRRRARS